MKLARKIKDELNNKVSALGKLSLTGFNLDNLAKVVGFEEDKLLGTNKADIASKAMEALGSPGNLSELFCWRAFDPEKDIFFNKDGGIGFVVDLSPLVRISDEVVRNLQHFFDKEMPNKSFLQFTLVASHKIGGLLNLWASARSSSDPFLQKITRQRYEYMKGLAEDYVNSGIKTARNYLIIASFNSFSLSEEEVINFKRQFVKRLKLLNLDPVILGAENLIDLSDEILTQTNDIYQRGNKVNHLMPLNEQAIRYGKSLLEKDEAVESDGIATRVYGVTNFPEEWSALEMIRLLGDGGSSGFMLTLPARFIINYVIASDLPKAANEVLVKRGEGVVKAAEQFIARFDDSLRKEAMEWRSVMAELKEGRRVLSSSFNIAITAPKEAIDEAEQSLITLYNMNDFEIKKLEMIQLPLLLSALPMQASYMWGFMHFMKQRFARTSKQLTALLPLSAEWKGNPVSGVLFQGRRGQLFNWNPFHKIDGGNFNVQIYGPSGVGKSVLIQEIATTLLSQGARMVIIDIGGSYRNICDCLGGEYIQFSGASDLSLNPFTGIADSTGFFRQLVDIEGDPIMIKTLKKGKVEYDLAVDAVTNARNIAAVMCGVQGDAHKEALIEGAIYKAVLEYGEDFTITDVSHLLKNGSEIERILGETLLPFTNLGIYGKYFNSRSNVTFKKQLTVFELEQISGDQTLLAVVMQVLSGQVFKQILCGDRSVKTALCLDEAWRVIDKNDKPIAEYTRTFRKYGAAVMVCVQNVSDLDSTEHRKTIAKNCEWTILLEQNDKGIKALEKSPYEELIPLIKSIRFVKGSHSEMLILSSRVTVIGKLLLDPYSQCLYSTDADDFKYLKLLTNKGFSLGEALDELVKQKEMGAR